MFAKPIYISSVDYTRLRLLAVALIAGKTGTATGARRLLAELDRAVMLAAHEMPPGVVQIDSRVTTEDLANGEVETYTLTLPERADPEQGRLSILAPIGTALLGYSEGDEVAWDTPGGLRRLRIRNVIQSELFESPAIDRTAGSVPRGSPSYA